MISSSSNKSSRNKIIYAILFFLFLSSIFYFFRNSAPVAFIEGEMQSIIAKQKSSFFAFGKGEDGEMKKARQENEERLNKIVDYELIKKDNEALKSQFETSGNITQTLANARILGFTGNSNLPLTLVINVGEKDGITKGMAVISQKILIGRISAVSINFSVVETVLNPRFKALAKLPETGANGIINGSNDFMLLDRVVITDTLKEGANVVTRGEVDATGIGIFPDLIIGKITSISKNETSPFQSAQVEPILDLSRLTNVFVIVSL